MAAPFRLATRARPHLPASATPLTLRAAPRQQLPSAQRLLSSRAPRRPSQSLVRAREAPRRSHSSQPPKKDPNRIVFWPLLAVFGITYGAWVLLVESRKDMAAAAKRSQKTPEPEPAAPTPAPPPAAAAAAAPRFDDSEVTVIFVLGGPGAGKGTQCARLVDRHDFVHLSAGDLLRAEQARPGSQFGTLISDCIRNGTIVPMEVTIKLLENAMAAALADGSASKKRFLIDGFPRKMDQALKFEETVCRAKMVLFYDCPEEAMEARLLERGKTSGRADDNAESIRKRFRTFIETSMPVVDLYEKEGRVVRIDASATPDAVFGATSKALGDRLGGDYRD